MTYWGAPIIIGINPKAKHSVESILQAVCEYYDVSMDDLKSFRGETPIVHARQIAAYIIRDLLRLSLKAISRVFYPAYKWDDHTSVRNAIIRASEEISLPKIFATKKEIEEIKTMSLRWSSKTIHDIVPHELYEQ